jgi:hypothetical protein
MGVYMKVPPRTLFFGQLVASLWSCFVQIGVVCMPLICRALLTAPSSSGRFQTSRASAPRTRRRVSLAPMDGCSSTPASSGAPSVPQGYAFNPTILNMPNSARYSPRTARTTNCTSSSSSVPSAPSSSGRWPRSSRARASETCTRPSSSAASGSSRRRRR